MRTVRYLLLTVAGGLLLIGCSDNFLNTQPKNIIASSTVWKDSSLADAYLNDIYTRMNFIGGTGFNSFNQTIPDAVGGEMRMQGAWQTPTSFAVTVIDEEGAGPLDYWPYRNIREANEFIQNVREGNFSESYKTRRVAEARWLRAFMYFEMVKRFGGVPLIKKPQDPDSPRDSLFVERASEQDVYDFIGAEMDAIADDLSSAAHNQGRVTKWTALALKSRAMLYAASIGEFGDMKLNGLLGIPDSEVDQYWQAAFDASMRIINNGPHSLYDENSDPAENFQNLFLTDCSGNPEAIFCERFDGENKGHNYTYQGQPAPASAWGSNFCAHWGVVENFEYQDGSSSPTRSELTSQQWSSEELFGTRDPRLEASVQYPEITWQGETLYYHAGTRVNGEVESSPQTPISVSGADWPQAGAPRGWRRTGLLVKKRVDEAVSNPLWNQDDTDWMVFRLGEIYLNAAEAAFYLNNGEAQGLIDQLRSRAGMPSKPVTEDLIRNERQVELAFESHRYWDLRRWRIAEDVLDGTRMKGVEFIYDWDTKKYDVSLINAEGRARTFQERHYYLPLGTNRLADNPELVENPGY